MNILEIKDLRVSFQTYAGKVCAVRGIDISIEKGKILAIVGESGCGKSVTAQTILKLNPSPPSIIESGEILFDGKDIIPFKEKQMREIRGKEIGMIFQDPMTCLDPTKTVGYQMMEALQQHEKVSKQEAYARSIEMLEKVGISNAVDRMSQYPHQFSGGMRQRAMIASALICNPTLLIADEPTTALDVTIQAQIVDLMLQLRKNLGTSILIITHDMGVVADIADEVCVMYGGEVVEKGNVREIFYNPKHPYTWGLLNSIPRADQKGKDLVPIDGTPPDLLNPPKGCPFYMRCKYAMNICKDNKSPEYCLSESHKVKCFLLHENAPKVENPLIKEGNDA